MSLTASYNLVKAWNGGFTGEITITNTGDAPIEDWFLNFGLDASVVDTWRSQYVQEEDGSYTVSGAAYNSDIAPGESITIGFKASGDGNSVEPVFHLSTIDEQPAPEPTPASEPVSEPASEPVSEPAPEPEPTLEPAPEPAPTTGDSGSFEPTPSSNVIEVAAGTSAAELQKIIDGAAAGSVVRLAAGNFTFDRTVTIDRDDITLEGAGSDKTTIIVDQPSGKEGPAIHVVSSGTSGSYKLASDAQEGDTSIKLSGGHDFQAGDFVWIERPNTQEFFDQIGDTSWQKDKPLRTSIARVVEVKGDTLKLENGIHFDYDNADATVKKLDMVENVSLRGFSLEYTLGEPTPGDMSNTKPAYDRVAAVDYDGTYNARLDDIAVHDSGSHAFQFKKTLSMAADSLFADGAHNKGSGGNGYAYELKEVYESSLTNLEDHNMRHSLLFASWYSAANNTAHVKFTDRDINFHGGRDHGNVVHVDVSERDPAEDNMSSTVTYNSEGKHYGAPTEAGANTLTFSRVVGSKRDDVVKGADNGVILDGRGAHDTLTGGKGDDVLIGGDGRDVLDGGDGEDVARYSGSKSDYSVTKLSNGGYEVDGTDGRDQVFNIEWLVFENGDKIALDGAGGSVPEAPAEVVTTEPAPTTDSTTSEPTSDGGTSAPTTDSTTSEPAAGGSSGETIVLTGTNGNDTFLVDDPAIVVDAGGGWDHVEASVTYTMDPDVEKLTLLGNEDLEGIGNGSRNVMRGNEAGNKLKGEDGDDELWARGGNDDLYGGAGNDALHGQDGDDMLMAGGGVDTMAGGRGADRFRFDNAYESDAGERDQIADFNCDEGDRMDLSRFDADATAEGRQSFRFVGEKDFSGEAGELRFSGGVLSGDTDGDGSADFEVEMVGVTSMHNDDFLV